MMSQAFLPKPNRKYVPAAIAACFFVLSSALYGAWRVSPAKQAERALREYYSYSVEEPRPDFLNDDPEVKRTFVREVILTEDAVSSEESKDSAEKSYRYQVAYTMAQEKGNHTATPLIEESAEGRITMKNESPEIWENAGQ